MAIFESKKKIYQKILQTLSSGERLGPNQREDASADTVQAMGPVEKECRS